MGISVIPYEKDKLGYDALYDVIKHWAQAVDLDRFYFTYGTLEDAVRDYSKSKADKVIQIINNNIPQRKKFMMLLQQSDNPFPWIKRLNEEKYFDPLNNPAPEESKDGTGGIIEERWLALDVLRRAAKLCKSEKSVRNIQLVKNILDRIIQHEIKSAGIRNRDTYWSITEIICLLPENRISERHIDFIRIAIKSSKGLTPIDTLICENLLEKLINGRNKKLLLKLLDILFEYEFKNSSYEKNKPKTYIDPNILESALKKHKSSISELCAEEAARIAINRIQSIIEVNRYQFESYVIPTIENHEQTYFTEDLNCQLTYFVRDMLEKMQIDRARVFLVEFLGKKHSIFHRIALHVINKKYEYFNDLFWKWRKKPLNEYSSKHEIYELIKSNCNRFTEEQVNRIIKWIEILNYDIRPKKEKDKERAEIHKAYEKKEWLMSLEALNNEKVKLLFEKYNKINNYPVEHPGFSSWVGRMREADISPIDQNKLSSMSNEEIVGYLNGFEQTNRFEEPTIRGLSDTLKATIIEKPAKFENDLMSFIDVPIVYQISIINAFDELARNKSDILWNNILDFIKQIVISKNTWSPKKNDEKYDYREWIITNIARLIKNGLCAGIKKQKRQKNEIYEKMKYVLFIIEKKAKNRDIDLKDVVSSVLNSPKGEIYEALFLLAIRMKEISVKYPEKHWDNEIKEFFVNGLKSKANNIELYCVLGKYITNIYHYLDDKWIEKNIVNIFNIKKKGNWEAAFSGYMFYLGSVSKEIYELLKNTSIFDSALLHEFKMKEIENKLVKLICYVYLLGWDSLEDESSIINKILDQGDPKKLDEIAIYIRHRVKKNETGYQTNLDVLWARLFSVAKRNKQNDEHKKVLSSLTLWISLVDEINEVYFNYLKESIEYINIGYNSSHLLKALKDHSSKTPQYCGELLYEIAQDESILPYKQIIEEITEILYQEQQIEIANKICSRYGQRGFIFLKDLYDKYNNNDGALT